MPEDTLRCYLSSKAANYTALNGDDGLGDVLTIDDSTVGGARACRIARSLGHEVTLFINGLNVARTCPYFFSLLDSYLDQNTQQALTFGGLTYDLVFGDGLRRLRQAIRAKLMAVKDEEALIEIKRIGSMFTESEISIPEHYRTIETEELNELVALGVRIESHGWSHRDISAMSEVEIEDDLLRNRIWIEDKLNVRVSQYAVPFGLYTPSAAIVDRYAAVLLCDHSKPLGLLRPGLWNRLDITSALQDGSSL